MSKNPCCIRAIPYESEDSPSFTMCLYTETNDEKISKKIKMAAKEMFKNYNIEFHDLLRRPSSKIFTPLPTSKKQKGKELADLTRKIDKNLHLFENRMNVTAVQASYKVTDSIEQDKACVRVYVLGKGKIPAGETDIMKIKEEHGDIFDQAEFDVAEGYHKLTTGSSLKGSALPLEGGVGIGVQGVNAAGTLGGFLEDEEGNVYILSNKHVLHPTDTAGNAIFQPSHCDYEDMRRTTEGNIQRWINERQRILEENEETNQECRSLLVRRLSQKIQTNENILSEIQQNPSRHIGTYFWGLENNVRVNGQDFYVDAAIATLHRNELDVMRYHKSNIEDRTNRCPLYGFETNKYWITQNYNPPNGKIIDFPTFQDLVHSEDPELRFMKIGRTTGFTDEGYLHVLPFFLRGTSSDGYQLEWSWAPNCYHLWKCPGSFSEKGDSGSLVFDRGGRALGLVFGMLTDLERGFTYSVVSPLFAILHALKREREKSEKKELRLWQVLP